jgi:16S rRNA (guanine527-N7)-methyltransferase
VNDRAKELLVAGVASLGLHLTTAELAKFIALAAELKKWGRKINLTAIREDEDVAIKHFLDSLTLLRIIGTKGNLLDIGSGGGFPAIPLKIMSHDMHIVSVDAVEKKIIFQRHVARQLSLKHFEALHARAEELSAGHAGRFDWIVSRAFTDVPTFVRIALPLLAEGGCIIAMKGKGGREEAAVSLPALQGMAVRVSEIIEFRLAGHGDLRVLIVMKRC